MYVCTQVRVYVWIHVRAAGALGGSWWHFFSDSLYWAEAHQARLSWLTCKLRGSSILSFTKRWNKCVHHALHLRGEFWGWNPGPWACEESALLTESSPQAWVPFIKSLFFGVCWALLYISKAHQRADCLVWVRPSTAPKKSEFSQARTQRRPFCLFPHR